MMNGLADEIRVLHVDDNLGFADVVATHLEREKNSITVTTAANPPEGLSRLDDDIDCVVSDYDMPEMDGIEFLETVREERSDLPFIMFTNKGSEEVASEAISSGVTGYLQKDGNTETFELLCQRIENAVARHRARTSYRELFEKMPVGLTIHDTETGEIIDANPAFADLLGYEPEEIEGTHPGELAPVNSPFDREYATRLIQQTVDAEPVELQWRDQTKTGEVIPVNVTLKQTTINGQQRVLAVVRERTESDDTAQ